MGASLKDEGSDWPQWFVQAYIDAKIEPILNTLMEELDMATKTPLRPIQDRVVIKRVPVSDAESAPRLLWTPEQDEAKKSQVGDVVTVGPGRRDPATGALVPMTVKRGDRVVVGLYSGGDVDMDGESYLIAREADIQAILTK